MSWPTAPLGEISTLNPQTPKGLLISNEEVAVVPMAAVSELGSMRIQEYRPANQISPGLSYFADGDVLLAKITPCFENNKITVASVDRAHAFGSTEFHVVRVNPRKLDAHYLSYFLRQDSVRDHGKRRMTGSGGQRRVPKAFLEALEIPLPPLDEQRRIAAILDEADALRRAASVANLKLSSLVLSWFEEMFSRHVVGPLVGVLASPPILPARWKLASLREVARLATGHTPSRRVSEYWNGDVPWLTLGDVRALDGKVAYDTNGHTTPKGIEKSSAVILPRGTVCFSRTASVGFVTIMGKQMATSQDFVNWVCGPSLTSEYLMWSLIHARPHFLGLASGSTHRTIYFPTVESFSVILPPIDVQETFGRRISQVAAIKRVSEDSESRFGELFTSLQHRAFNGELTSRPAERELAGVG